MIAGFGPSAAAFLRLHEYIHLTYTACLPYRNSYAATQMAEDQGHPHGGSEGGRRGELAIGWPRLVVDAAGIFSNFELRNGCNRQV